MVEVHEVMCARCESREKMDGSVFDDKEYRLPDDWHEFDVDHAGATSHLCPDCWDKYLLIEEEFLNEEHVVK